MATAQPTAEKRALAKRAGEAGYMEDNPDNDDLTDSTTLPPGVPNLEELSRNACAFVNIMVRFSDSTVVGIEGSDMETDYMDGRHFHNTRFQFSLIHDF